MIIKIYWNILYVEIVINSFCKGFEYQPTPPKSACEKNFDNFFYDFPPCLFLHSPEIVPELSSCLALFKLMCKLLAVTWLWCSMCMEPPQRTMHQPSEELRKNCWDPEERTSFLRPCHIPFWFYKQQQRHAGVISKISPPIFLCGSCGLFIWVIAGETERVHLNSFSRAA